VGAEVIDAALRVTARLEDVGGQPLTLERGGPIGRVAERELGSTLPDDVVRFCERIFERGGAVLNGPGGGRYVYDLRQRLSLFMKVTPVQIRNGLATASPLRPETLAGVDLLLLRENLGGHYQGEAEVTTSRAGGRVVRHCFSDVEVNVRRFLSAAARLAAARRGALTVVAKEAGLPEVSDLWRACATDVADAHGVECSLVDVDLMVYQLVTRPSEFDVIAAPNLCGDVLSDLAAVLVGSRAMLFSGNFTADGHGVYQTNHGAAHDIAGTDRANPVGQILSLAMLLRESLGLDREARAVEEGVRRVWDRGHRTADIAGPADRPVGTREMAELVADAAAACFLASPESG
jgi:3-isopropylmalate dehydrogenase